MKRLHFALYFILAAVAVSAQDIFPQWPIEGTDEFRSELLVPDFTSDGISYHFIPGRTDEVAVMNCHNLVIHHKSELTDILEALYWDVDAPDITDVTVPAKVYHEGNEYTVTMVLYGAFAKWKSLKSVTLPETITEVRPGAFGGCSALEHAPALHVDRMLDWMFIECASIKTIDLTPYTSFDYIPLSGCAGLEEVRLSGSREQVNVLESRFYTHYWNAPDIEVKGELKRIYISDAAAAAESCSDYNVSAFSDTEYTEATLYVPAGTREIFVASPFWGHFTHIEEGQYSGAAKVETDESYNIPVEYYNLQGQRIARPEKGIVIELRGNKAQKVIR